jgi:hypothetical protein
VSIWESNYRECARQLAEMTAARDEALTAYRRLKAVNELLERELAATRAENQRLQQIANRVDL